MTEREILDRLEYFLWLKVFLLLCQTAPSSAWSGDLGGNYWEVCWCTSNLDKSGFVCCTWYSNWEEFVALSTGTGLYFLLVFVYNEFDEFERCNFFFLHWHLFVWTWWIRLLVYCWRYLILVVCLTFWLWSIYVSSMLL